MLSKLHHSLLILACVAANIARADDPSPLAPPQSLILKQVKFKQRLDNPVPVETVLHDEAGRDVTLAECIADKPTILVMAYFRCPMLCNQVLNGVTRSLRGVNFQPGQEISVIVVSFDPTETPQMAAAKREAIVNAYRPGASNDGWHFLTGDDASVRSVADSVGFEYVYDETTKQYAHASGIVVLTPAGHVSRYFYGIDYPTRDVRMGLVEASAGKIGSAVDELLLLCFHYDPLTGKYGFAIMQLIRGTSIVLVLGMVGFIGYSLRQERSQQPVVASDGRDFDATTFELKN